MTSARTALLGRDVLANAVTAAPFVLFTSAMFLCVAPPTVVNEPPRYTLFPAGRIVYTVPFTFGFHGSTLPVVMSIAATWFRVTVVAPFAEVSAVKLPPMYAVFPTTIMSRTVLLGWYPTSGVCVTTAASAVGATNIAPATASAAATATRVLPSRLTCPPLATERLSRTGTRRPHSLRYPRKLRRRQQEKNKSNRPGCRVPDRADARDDDGPHAEELHGGRGLPERREPDQAGDRRIEAVDHGDDPRLEPAQPLELERKREDQAADGDHQAEAECVRVNCPEPEDAERQRDRSGDRQREGQPIEPGRTRTDRAPCIGDARPGTAGRDREGDPETRSRPADTAQQEHAGAGEQRTRDVPVTPRPCQGHAERGQERERHRDPHGQPLDGLEEGQVERG